MSIPLYSFVYTYMSTPNLVGLLRGKIGAYLCKPSDSIKHTVGNEYLSLTKAAASSRAMVKAQVPGVKLTSDNHQLHDLEQLHSSVKEYLPHKII